MFYSNKVKSINAESPVWVIYACLFLGFVLIIVSFCQELFRLAKKKTQSMSPTNQPEKHNEEAFKP
jgi:TRAP-type C4-dicarboxylate transport system permease small subunit